MAIISICVTDSIKQPQDVWFLVHGVWFLESGILTLPQDFRFLGHGVWFLESGIFGYAAGAWEWAFSRFYCGLKSQLAQYRNFRALDKKVEISTF